LTETISYSLASLMSNDQDFPVPIGYSLEKFSKSFLRFLIISKSKDEKYKLQRAS